MDDDTAVRMPRPGAARLDPFAAVPRRLAALSARAVEHRSVRIWRPWPVMAFSRRDERSPRFALAAREADACGFQPAVRPVGGTFAPLHAGSLVVDEYGWDDAPLRTAWRFERHAAALADAFRALGVDARIGAVPGEYCPGEHSVNAAGVAKVSGTAQRVARGAWLVSSVVQVQGADALRAVTGRVAHALGADVDLDTIGTLEQAVPGIHPDDVVDALTRRFIADGARGVEWAG